MFAACPVGTIFLRGERRVSLKQKNGLAKALSKAFNLTIPGIEQKFNYQFKFLVGLGYRLRVLFVDFVLLSHKTVHVVR